MALKKNIKLENGIMVTYHRISSLNKITNISNNIEVNSYIDEEEREKEKEYQRVQEKNVKGETLTPEEYELLQKGINVLVYADYISTPYVAEMTIEDAYEYLKTTDKYNDAEDV